MLTFGENNNKELKNMQIYEDELTEDKKYYALIDEIKKINSEVEIRILNPAICGSKVYKTIYNRITPYELRLPAGFVYNGKNEITDRKDINLEVLRITPEIENLLLPENLDELEQGPKLLKVT